MRTLCAGAILLAALTACSRGLADRVENADAMRAEVLALAPLGTDLAEARRRVEGAGFRCEAPGRATFTGSRDSLRFAYCSAERARGAFETRRFQLALVDSAGRLAEVRVTTGLVAP
jgi:hypothetical protein